MINDSSLPLFVDGECEPLCEAVEILEKRISTETGEESLVVAVHSRGNGIPFEVSRKKFIKSSFFDELTLHGLSIIESEESYAKLRASIEDSERQAPLVYYHEQMGFRTICKTQCFLGYKPIGKLSKTLKVSKNLSKEKILKPQGDLSVWIAFVRRHIVPSVELSLALMLGATAPVSHILKEEHEFVDIPVWALVNGSSKGKTTLLYLIASMFASPRNFIDTFNATSNALYAMLEERGGYPFLCDEATHTPNLDWDSMLYTLPTGKERRRCDNKGKLKPIVEFGGAVIMTSEVSILDRSQKHGGQECRIIEFAVDPFQKNPRLAEEVRKICFSNYGWTTEPLLKLLLDPVEKEKLTKKYQRFLRTLEKKVSFEVTGIERRLLQRCALILVSGWILRKAIRCNFDLKAIEAYLLKCLSLRIATRDDRDEADKIIDKVAGFVNNNLDKFPTASSLSSKTSTKHFSPFWGATGFYGTKACAWIEESVTEERILPRELRNKNTTLQALHQKGYVEKFYDTRYVITRDFGRVKAKYYCFLLPDSPSLMKKLDDFSDARLSVATLNAMLAEDHDKKNYENFNAERDLPYIAISRGGNNSYAVFASKQFCKSMAISAHSTLFATYIEGEQTLLLTKSNVAINSIPLRFDKESEGSVAKGISVNNLLDKLAKTIPLNHRLVMTEISFDEYKNQPGAVVNLQNYALSIEPEEHPPVDFTIKRFPDDGRRHSQLKSLLNDDEEDN